MKIAVHERVQLRDVPEHRGADGMSGIAVRDPCPGAPRRIFPDGYDVVVLGNTWDQYPGHFDPIALLRAVHATLPP